MIKGHILVVDDERNILKSLKDILNDEGYEVSTATDGEAALRLIQSDAPDVILLDIWITGMDGIQILKSVKEQKSDIEIIMMSGHGTIDTAVKATKMGAYDFIEKPFSLENVIMTVENAIKQQRADREDFELRRMLSKKTRIIGDHPSVEKIREQIESGKSIDNHLYINGEDGTGKELIARIMHNKSSRWNKPFIKINCSAMQEDAEKILFGIESNPMELSFGNKKGKLEQASGGILFLDKIYALKKKTRKKLINAIKTKKFRRLNNNSYYPIDIILMFTSSNIDISKDDETMREFIAESYQIVTVPLRKRKEDIPVLVNYFLSDLVKEFGKKDITIGKSAMELFTNYKWPGNIKELKNIMERIVITSASSSVINCDDLPSFIKECLFNDSVNEFEHIGSFKETEMAWEKEFILHHLKKSNWDIDKVFKRLNIDKKGLKKKIEIHKISLVNNRNNPGLGQRTLKNSVVVCGQGLHSGLKTGLILSPLPPFSGIVFEDISSGERVPAHLDFVESTDYATTLKKGQTTVRTIEHIMAVLHMYKITNLLIKVGDEVPIMDGSAKDFCQLMENGGFEDQEGYVNELTINKRYEFSCNNSYITIEPSDEFIIDYLMDYPQPIGVQKFTFHAKNSGDFKENIAPARTFGFLKDFEKLEEMGLASGGRLSNLILVDNEKVINAPLRFPDEFVRHKILDILGDFYLLGRPIKGYIKAKMTGHSENIKLLKTIKEHIIK